VNLPNQLTVSRFVLAALLMIALGLNGVVARVAALVLFAAASLTDALDGHLARSRNAVTRFGQLMDPLADKVLVCAALVGLVGLQLAPAWMVLVIIAREFMVTGLRLLVAEDGTVVAAGWLGKLKTIFQMTAILLLLGARCFPVVGSYAGVQVYGLWLGGLCLWLAVFFTVLSGADYFWKLRHAFLRDT